MALFSLKSRPNGHDEMIATIGQTPDAFTFVETVDEVDSLLFGPHGKLAYLTQRRCLNVPPVDGVTRGAWLVGGTEPQR